MAKSESSDPRDLLRKARATATTAAPKAQKEERSVMPLSPEGIESLIAFAEAKQIGERCHNVEDENGRAVKTEGLDRFTEVLWRTHSVPSNPAVVAFAENGSVDASATFLVKAMFRLNRSIPQKREVGRTPRDYLAQALTMGDNGLSEVDANSLLDAEVDCEPILNVAVLTFLLLGREIKGTFIEPKPEGIAAATKLLKVITADGKGGRVTFDAFTDAERAILLVEDDSAVRMRDSKGFLNRVLNYCRSLEQLRHVLTVIPPDLALAQVKLAENAGVKEIAERRKLAAIHVLGLADEAEFS